jgi:hypothetical protein
MKKKLLKGNYTPEGNPEIEEQNSSSSTTHEFEKKAIERLGGSIAFVRGGKLFDENN